MASFKGVRGESNFVAHITDACNDVLKKHHLCINSCDTIKEFCSQISDLLDENKINQLLLLIDEADDFLDSISGNSYQEILPLIDLKRKENGQFKFVFAGLHNVCRAKNATKDNGLFGQLGTPLCIRPLTPADARYLLVRPLKYLGFKISNESHIDTILTNTNYYPGIIQFFGYTLVQTLGSQYNQYYSAVNGNPPFDLKDDQLASIMNSRDLNKSIKDRIRWTLEMDKRYYMLARCIAVLYHLNGDDVAITSGYSIDEIRELSDDTFGIHCLGGLSRDEYTALLDEMEEMGILSKPNQEENRYLLRRRSFMDVIGPDLNALETEINDQNEEEA